MRGDVITCVCVWGGRGMSSHVEDVTKCPITCGGYHTWEGVITPGWGGWGGVITREDAIDRPTAVTAAETPPTIPPHPPPYPPIPPPVLCSPAPPGGSGRLCARPPLHPHARPRGPTRDSAARGGGGAARGDARTPPIPPPRPHAPGSALRCGSGTPGDPISAQSAPAPPGGGTAGVGGPGPGRDIETPQRH